MLLPPEVAIGAFGKIQVSEKGTVLQYSILRSHPEINMKRQNEQEYSNANAVMRTLM